MKKYDELVQAEDKAWEAANADYMNDALFKAGEAASKARSDFEARLYAKRAEFEALSQHDKADPAVCRENAGDATGYDEKDIEFWDICVAEAKNFIDGVYD